jgi:hypothetical protein
MSGPRAVNDLIAVWLAGLPSHEMRAFNDLSLAMAFAKEKAELLPQTIDRRCAALINTKLDEAEHWMHSALREAVDRADQVRAVAVPAVCLGHVYDENGHCVHCGRLRGDFVPR